MHFFTFSESKTPEEHIVVKQIFLKLVLLCFLRVLMSTPFEKFRLILNKG